MSDRPILFSAPMIRALLEGRKMQTRRVLKVVPDAPAMDNVVHAARHPEPYLDAYCSERKTQANPRGMSRHWSWWTRDDRPGRQFNAGFAPGDRLWVREAWRPGYDADGYREDLGRVARPADFDPASTAIEYLANGTNELSGKSRPGIHMPRWASRLTLLVTDVRVQRLQEITEADAFAEGLEKIDVTLGPKGEVVPLKHPQAANEWPHGPDGEDGYAQDGWDNPVAVYADLWRSLHGKGAWETNPWVVAVTFTVHRANIDALPAAGAEREMADA